MSVQARLLLLAVSVLSGLAPAFADATFDSGRALIWGTPEERAVLDAHPELAVRQELPAAAVIEGTPQELAELAAAGHRLIALPDRHQLLLRGGPIDVRDFPLTPTDLPKGSRAAPFLVAFDGMPVEAWKKTLRRLGARIVGPVPHAGFLVLADTAAVEALQTRPEVVGIVAYRPEWKISGRVPPGPVPATVEVTTFPDTAGDLLARRAATLGRLERSYSLFSRSAVTVEVNRGALHQLAEMPEVEWIDVNTNPGLYNNEMRVIMQTDKQHFQANTTFYNPIYAIGVWGESQTVTVADTGQAPHEVFYDPSPPKVASYTLAPCVTGPGDAGDHGTVVSSVLLGDKADTASQYGSANDYDGLAVRSRLSMQDWDNDTTAGCMPNDPIVMLTQYFYPAFLAGSMIHTNSWGHNGNYNEGTGTYSPISYYLDLYLSDPAFREQVLIFAAGNGGATFPGLAYFPYSTSDEAHAKNVIAVGGSDNGSARHVMYNFSSRGPTNDCGVARTSLPCPGLGRIKPDIVAPAVTLMAASAVSPTTYSSMYNSGTSFAAPAVAAASALIRDYFDQDLYPNDLTDPPLLIPKQPSAALVKAMLVNSAVFLFDDTAFESVGVWNLIQDAYPNYDQGYGRPVLDNVLEPAGYKELKVYEDATTWFSTSGQAPWERVVQIAETWGATCNTLRVTLAWADPPMTLGAGSALVNDLDLEVDFGGVTYLGNHLLTGGAVPDTTNNVEDVLIPMGKVTAPNVQPTIRVRGTSVPQGIQPFAVVVTYGACFDNIPCGTTPPVGGCYRGPQDIVPRPGVVPPPACWEQTYSLSPPSGQSFPHCTPPVPCPVSDTQRGRDFEGEPCSDIQPVLILE